MTKTAKPAASPASAEQKTLEKKWGPTAIAAGWTALPNVLFTSQKALNLSHLDVLVLLHLASFWWNHDKNPFPSKAKLADALNVDPRTVQRSIQKMEKLGYVTRIQRQASVGDNLTNEYDLRPLIKHLQRLAEQELAIRAARQAEDKARKATPKVFALVAGGKK